MFQIQMSEHQGAQQQNHARPDTAALLCNVDADFREIQNYPVAHIGNVRRLQQQASGVRGSVLQRGDNAFEHPVRQRNHQERK